MIPTPCRIDQTEIDMHACHATTSTFCSWLAAALDKKSKDSLLPAKPLPYENMYKSVSESRNSNSTQNSKGTQIRNRSMRKWVDLFHCYLAVSEDTMTKRT